MADVILDVGPTTGFSYNSPEYSAVTRLTNNVFVYLHGTSDNDTVVVSVFRIDGLKTASPSAVKLSSRMFNTTQLAAADIDAAAWTSQRNREICKLNDTDVLVKFHTSTHYREFAVIRVDASTYEVSFVGNVIQVYDMDTEDTNLQPAQFGTGAMVNITENVVITDIVKTGYSPNLMRFNWDPDTDTLTNTWITNDTGTNSSTTAFRSRFAKSRTFSDDGKVLWSYASRTTSNQTDFIAYATSSTMAYGDATTDWTVYDTGLGTAATYDLGIVLPINDTDAIHLSTTNGAEKLVNGVKTQNYPNWNNLTNQTGNYRTKWANWLDANHFFAIVQLQSGSTTDVNADRKGFICQYDELTDELTASPFTIDGTADISEMTNTNNDHNNRIEVYDPETILFYSHESSTGKPVVKIITTAA